MLILPALPAAPVEEDLQAEIVVGCIYSVGEFGAELVEICRKDNLAAALALRDYPPHHARIIEGCSRRLMASRGWAGVKECVDQEIEQKTEPTQD
jgi:hypothetical protein